MIIGNDWDKLLESEFEQEYFQSIMQFLDEEYVKGVVYPKREEIFSALKLTPYEKVRVLIVGQDPYHGEGQAHGLAFSVLPGVQCPPSLKNIYKELSADIGCTIPNNGYLRKWAGQGVLLLNSVLTVREGQANSHKQCGWEKFTNKIIALLNLRKEPIIFLLWGANAKEKLTQITGAQHVVLSAAHPSPLSAYQGFFGCRHFSKVNRILEENGEEKIDWQIENIS